MKTKPYSRYAALACMVSLIIFSGCASTPPTRFYSLHSVITQDTIKQTASADPDLIVGIGPVAVPDYLDRPQIVTRSGENELNVAEFHRWAGNLRNEIARVMAENLSVLLLTDHVYIYPWMQSIPVNYRVIVNVIRFDGVPGDDISVKINWIIYGEDGKKALKIKTSEHSRQAEGSGYGAMVTAKSRVLADLSREIADTIKSVNR